MSPFRTIANAFAFAMLALASPVALHAADEDAAVTADPYDALYAAINQAENETATIENLLDTMEHTLESQDPNIAAIETLRPGFLEGFSDVMRPWIFEHTSRVKAIFRPRLIAAMTEELTPEEAGRMADFYASPTGAKLMRNVTGSYTGANMLGDIDDFNPDVAISAEAVDRDINAAAMKGALAMSKADYDHPDAAPLRDPALMVKMSRLGVRLVELRTQMENSPLDPDVEQGITTDVEQYMQRTVAEIEADRDQ